MTDLIEYGFVPTMIDESMTGIPARVVAVHKGRYELVCEYGVTYGVLKKSEYFAEIHEEFPVTGDFVMILYNLRGESQIIRTLDRKSKFSRNDFSGHLAAYVKTIREQVVAANFDYVFIMSSLNNDLNMKRIERYLALSLQSGAVPAVILTKADLADDPAERQRYVENMVRGISVYAVSSKTGYGMDNLSDFIMPRKTIVFLGSSGVGKSSLVNKLAGGEVMQVKQIREDDSRGRHTTSHRQLIMLPGGAMVIDTPGLREIGMWDADAGLSETFSDIEELFLSCRFNDCSHGSEPGCAVREAIKDGRLSAERWENYVLLKKEARFVEDKAGFLRQKNDRFKEISKLNKAYKKKT